MRTLVVNAGSSSLQHRRLDPGGTVAAEADLDRWEGEGAVEPVRAFLDRAGPVDAVGHRVVHGGTEHAEPVVVDDAVLDALESLTPLAPLHQPRALAGIRAVRPLLPDVPQVACFDTAFFATLPPAATTYALPRQWNARFGLRRFGFHGLSHAYAARRGADVAGRSGADARIVTCHLGAGASLAGVVGGRAVDTTMGFTPLEGLVMATRSGSVDPGLLMWLLEQGGLAVAEVSRGLTHESGLAGLTGGSGDMRDLLDDVHAGDPAATAALDVYVHRLAREVAAMAAATGGLDVLVFTGGVGEHATEVRIRAARRLAWLGADVDPPRNREAQGDADLSAPGALARTVVVTAREDLEIVRQVRATVGG